MAGEQLREKVTFQRRTADENGDLLGDWGDALTVFARVRAMRGTEPVIQARLEGFQPLEVTVRSMQATREIDTDWRLTWDGKAYNIRSIAPDERHAFIAMIVDRDRSDA